MRIIVAAIMASAVLLLAAPDTANSQSSATARPQFAQKKNCVRCTTRCSQCGNSQRCFDACRNNGNPLVAADSDCGQWFRACR